MISELTTAIEVLTGNLIIGLNCSIRLYSTVSVHVPISPDSLRLAMPCLSCGDWLVELLNEESAVGLLLVGCLVVEVAVVG